MNAAEGKKAVCEGGCRPSMSFPAEQGQMRRGVGPPGPEMRRSSFQLGRHKASIERATVDIYRSGSRLSSDLLRLACVALSAGELSEWMCRHVVVRKEGICP
jgi:hypothetical protein